METLQQVLPQTGIYKMTTIAQIQRFIQRKRNRSNPVPFKEISLEVSARYGDGSFFFTPGQLSLIMDGKWDPEPEHIRSAYRLGARTCPTCKQKIRQPRAPKEPTELPPHLKWWRMELSAAARNEYIMMLFEDL